MKTRSERILEEKLAAKTNAHTGKYLKKSMAVLSTSVMIGTIATPLLSQAVSANETASFENSESASTAETSIEESAVTTDESTISSEETSTESDATVVEPEVAEETAPLEEKEVLTADEIYDVNIQEVQAPEANYATVQSAMMMRSTGNVYSFIDSISGSASEIAASNDLYASVMIAQAILESAYGTSALASAPNYNLFGIKGNYNGAYVNMLTYEDDGNGNYYQITAAFRKYPSYHQSLEDYAQVLRNGPSWNPNYYSGAWKSNTNSYQDATAWLTGRYATDTAYASKLNNLIVTYNLTQYDNGTSTGNTGGGNTGGSTGNTGGSTSNQTTHTVVAGDTLWAIANKYNVTVANLKSWNGLTSDVIYIGQVLKVSATGGNSSSGGGTNTGNTGNTGGSTSTGAKTYKVVSGDTLWGIASKHGVSVANLKAWNNLTSDTIYVGQTLKVSNGGNSASTGSGSNSNSGGSTSTGSTTTYKVVSGDSLWAIANKHGVSVANLKSWNNLTSDVIYVGQTLKINGSSTSSSTGNASSNNSGSTTSGTTYKVVSGDSLWAIANKHGVTVANLKAWNGLTSDIIYVGQTLKINASSSSSNNSAASSTNGTKYTVKSGDSLWAIALSNNTTVAKLKSLNNLSSDVIYVGQVLTVK